MIFTVENYKMNFLGMFAFIGKMEQTDSGWKQSKWIWRDKQKLFQHSDTNRLQLSLSSLAILVNTRPVQFCLQENRIDLKLPEITPL